MSADLDNLRDELYLVEQDIVGNIWINSVIPQISGKRSLGWEDL